MEKVFRTTEIQLASSLLSKKGFTYKGINENSKTEVEFIIQYSNKKTLLELLKQDLDNILNVDFEKYRENMYFLNQQILVYKIKHSI